MTVEKLDMDPKESHSLPCPRTQGASVLNHSPVGGRAAQGGPQEGRVTSSVHYLSEGDQ